MTRRTKPPRELQATRASQVRMPVELVQLQKLKDESGQPVVVRCQRVDELRMARLIGAWPGDRPVSLRDKQPKSNDPKRAVEIIEEYGPSLIEMGTALADDSGGWIRPAFWFSAPVPGALEGSLLSYADISLMVLSIMRLGGYVEKEEGTGPGTRFPGGRLKGPRSRGRAVVAGEGGGSDPDGGAPGPGPGGQPDGDAGGEGAAADPGAEAGGGS